MRACRSRLLFRSSLQALQTSAPGGNGTIGVRNVQCVLMVTPWQRQLGVGWYLPQDGDHSGDVRLHSLDLISDVFTALAFLAIAVSLIILVRRAHFDAPFRRMVSAFAVLVSAAGLTHLAEVWTPYGDYAWVPVTLALATAAAAVATAVVLPLFLPAALRMIRAAMVSEHRRHKLEAAHHELQALYGRLKESEQARSEQFTNVSHELRTPLSLILGPARSLLDDETLRPAQRSALETVVRNARLLEKHVNDLLLVAKGETGEVNLSPDYSAVDLAALARVTAGNFDGIAMQRDIRLTVQTPRTLQAEVDADAIERVLVNLLSNAFKFTPAKGRIRLTVEQEAQNALISVADSGPGVPEELRGMIFDRFRQADASSTRTHGGFGLGLAIVRSFIDMHGGRVSVGRAPEGGALFTVSLPIRAPTGEPVARSRSTSTSEPAVLTADLATRRASEPAEDQDYGDRPSVLVVEDNVEMNRFMTSTLGAEYQTRSALNGAAALEEARRAPPDLIVTDVMMPEMSGVELMNEVRSTEGLAHTPVLVVTARGDAELRTSLLRSGAQDFLTKPFTGAELSARAHNLITAKRARDHLSQEVSSQREDLEALARSVSTHRRELETALDETRVARELAEQASRMKSNLLRMMSHELRTPVTAVQLQLTLFERAEERSLNERQRVALERIRRSLRRLLDLIESALEYARIESGRFELRPSSFSFVDTVCEVVQELSSYAEQKGIDLRLEVEGRVPPLESDRQLVRLVTVNLVANAVKSTNEGGVTVRVLHRDQGHGLVVEDTGPGIPPSLAEEVFQPFKQVDDIRFREGAGSGLGLALVKEMVSALGGTIRLDSSDERGASFSVNVPPAPGSEHDVTEMRRHI